VSDKCSPELLLEIATWRMTRAKLVAQGKSSQAIGELDSVQISVFVTYSGELGALGACNFSLGHHDGTVATGKIAISDIETLESLQGVIRINLAARIHPHLDRSIPEIKANLLRSNAPPYVAASGPQAYTGKGVLVGIIDDAINERHPSFIKPNADPKVKLTRIVAIWDQITNPDATKGQTSPPGYSYGTFWDEASINAVLASGAAGLGAINLASQIDHGSHVTGIAAGNGAIKDNQFALYTFVGVAPEADIVFCNSAQLSTSSAASDAMNFIFDLASKRGQPCVINMSFGTNEGARDGSSDLEQAIDRALLDPTSGEPIPGRAVVVAAGNEADMRRHSRKSMDANGSLIFRLDVGQITFPNGLKTQPRPAGDTVIGFDKIYIWYDGAADNQIRVTAPGATPDPAGFVKPGQIVVNPAVGIVVSADPNPANGKKYITVTLFAPAKFGQWTIELQETAGAAAVVDLWVDRNGDTYIYPRLVGTDTVVDNTVTCPSTAKTAVAVGAYVSEPALNYGEHYGQICDFSSIGLDSTSGASEADTRPHIVAPGRRIIAPNNSSFADGERIIDVIASRFDGWTLSMHAVISGTSQAAPHTSGVVALMFQRNPKLTHDDIIQVFKASASKAQIPSGLTFPNAIWGYGKLDAQAALAAVPAPGGGV
jgi:subtilisin family serine protease